MASNLYIIGNGFDLCHGIPSAYSDYRRFLVERGKLPSWLEGIPEDALWSDVEGALAFSVPVFDGQLREACNSGSTAIRDFAKSETKRLDGVHDFIGMDFYEWVGSISLSGARRVFDFNEEDFFVNFNYTRTLEEVYGVDETRVLRPHGRFERVSPKRFYDHDVEINFGNRRYRHKANKLNEAIVSEFVQFGWHGNEIAKFDLLKGEVRGLDRADSHVVGELLEEVQDYFMSTHKDIDGNLRTMARRLADAEFDEVRIIGHNYAGPDRPYYTRVLLPRYQGLKWRVFADGEFRDMEPEIEIGYLNVAVSHRLPKVMADTFRDNANK